MVEETGSYFASLSLRLRFALLGLNGNMIILLYDLIWLCIYLTGVASQDPILAAYFTSGVAIASILALNVSSVIGVVSRIARGTAITRDPPAGARWGRLASVLSDM
ncbi:hypothetical protein JR316_0011539 [Psilocybe cubensis]|uniref:Uncharacterized protein n=1 Tax=Psilocybe cubensis TaxID=181762 RepID=A0ACB8GK48_PSICU|nr:hypothetical protein JR316_0011539 [Psilocybe cubensis]KAH9475974.1 hypothetical protein JR316_0011539 [Psilocybe cubensis]